MIWLKRTHGLDSITMREIADEANVSWNYRKISYRSKGIGYVDGDDDDIEAIQDAAEDLLGFRPRSYNPPDINDESDE